MSYEKVYRLNQINYRNKTNSESIKKGEVREVIIAEDADPEVHSKSS